MAISEIYGQVRAALDPLLEQHGFRLAQEHVHHESFGSAYALFRRGDLEARVIYDGRDNWIAVDASAHGDDFHDVTRGADVQQAVAVTQSWLASLATQS